MECEKVLSPDFSIVRLRKPQLHRRSHHRRIRLPTLPFSIGFRRTVSRRRPLKPCIQHSFKVCTAQLVPFFHSTFSYSRLDFRFIWKHPIHHHHHVHHTEPAERRPPLDGCTRQPHIHKTSPGQEASRRFEACEIRRFSNLARVSVDQCSLGVLASI